MVCGIVRGGDLRVKLADKQEGGGGVVIRVSATGNRSRADSVGTAAAVGDAVVADIGCSGGLMADPCTESIQDRETLSVCHCVRDVGGGLLNIDGLLSHVILTAGTLVRSAAFLNT